MRASPHNPALNLPARSPRSCTSPSYPKNVLVPAGRVTRSPFLKTHVNCQEFATFSRLRRMISGVEHVYKLITDMHSPVATISLATEEALRLRELSAVRGSAASMRHKANEEGASDDDEEESGAGNAGNGSGGGGRAGTGGGGPQAGALPAVPVRGEQSESSGAVLRAKRLKTS